MKLYSTGQVANMLGVHRDKIQSSLANNNCPKPSSKIGNRNAFNESDVLALFDWLSSRGVKVHNPFHAHQHTA